MPFELEDVVANSERLLELSVPPFTAGQLAEIDHVVGVSTLYLRRGIAQMLIQGITDPFFVGQIQSVSAYLFGLARVDPQAMVTSKAGAFWDAICAQCWDAAKQIATQSRMTHNPKREHEDDFLYVAYLMQRYFLAPEPEAAPEEQEAHAQAQAERLDRWEEVLDGGLDSRLNLCLALANSDAEAFEEAICAISDERDADLVERNANDAVRDEDMVWKQPIWPEGLALLRLAQRDGLVDPGLVVPRVPSLIVADNPFLYDPNAWRTQDYRATRRL